MLRRLLCLALAVAALAALPVPSLAQLAALTHGGGGQPFSKQQPVTFTADQVQYDRDNGLVTATGHVQAWQNDHVLMADKVTFDRNTNVAAASGHVVLVEPDGQVLFATYAELTQGMRDAVLRGMRAILAENGKLAANGARRIGAKINEMSRAVYSTCDVCRKHPEQPPLWQLRARTAVDDAEHKRIEYEDALLDIYGVPVFYMPYFWNAEPSVKRASGFLMPSIGSSKHIGPFFALPYYWVLDPSSDVTITPTLGTKAGQVDALYRRRFNDGRLTIDTALGYDNGAQAYIDAKGQFDYNENWRYGFDIERATSSDYLRDFRIPFAADVLNDEIYAEGFGVGAYSRVDLHAYQSVDNSVTQSNLPYALPRYEYSFFGEPDALGGRSSFDVQAFNVLRGTGTDTLRPGMRYQWDRPFVGDLGETYKLTVRLDAAAYSARDMDEQPNFAPEDTVSTAKAQPTVALEAHWPLIRDGGGQQLIEPIVQLIAAPNGNSYFDPKVPNEDSFDLQFNDATLFSLNRYPGLDRQEGGLRANVGLHGAWYIGGTTFDALIGQSYKEHVSDNLPPESGFQDHVSDIVARASFIPTDWLDLTSRFRFDHKNWNVDYAEGLASVGRPIFRVTGGYLYNNVDFYQIDTQPTIPASYFTPLNEIQLGASTHFGHWTFSASGSRNLQNHSMIGAGMNATFENECLIFNASFYRRYTSFNGDNGDTTLLFQITLKTVGQFGFNAL